MEGEHRIGSFSHTPHPSARESSSSSCLHSTQVQWLSILSAVRGGIPSDTNKYHDVILKFLKFIVRKPLKSGALEEVRWVLGAHIGAPVTSANPWPYQ
jgi:hypothetical protein